MRYEEIARGAPVDGAVTRARKALFARSMFEFATPVLFMRARDGRIFDMADVPAPPEAPDVEGAAPTGGGTIDRPVGESRRFELQARRLGAD